MKSNMLALMSALVGLTSLFGGLIAYKLLNRQPPFLGSYGYGRNIRLTSGSFRELYSDNAEALKGGDK